MRSSLAFVTELRKLFHVCDFQSDYGNGVGKACLTLTHARPCDSCDSVDN